MPTTFSRSMRSLATDGFSLSVAGVLLAAALLGSWTVWFLLARVAVYEVSDTARLEAERAVHPVEAPVAGRVVTTYLAVGQEVHAGDVLVDLDAEAERLQLMEERARLAAHAVQRDALRQEMTAEEEVRRDERQAGRLAHDEARARYREAEVVARSAEEEAQLFARIEERGLPARLDVLRTRAEAQKRLAAADTLRVAVGRLEADQRTRESERKARLERLRREVVRLEGEMATAAATIERLEHEIDKRHIRVPVAGRLGEAANLRSGTVVSVGDTLGAIIPAGDLKVAAHFLPRVALGRIQPGQPARLRLEGFPWTQYGSVAATVVKVADEPRDGRIRVELAIQDRPASIPLQHGLPGVVEVEVERVSPATLVLRVAGKRWGARTNGRALEGSDGVGR